MSTCSLIGVPAFLAGVAGTAKLPSGAIVVAIEANAASGTPGTMVMFGQPSVAIPAGTQLSLDFKHALWVAKGALNTTATNIVFAGTSSFTVHYVAAAY
jgi:hypothetical protein